MAVRALLLAFAVGFIAFMPGVQAVEPDEILKDPGLEARARKLSAGLRCLVCQNQSIDDSNAPLARDLRLLVRERLQAGDSDSDVLNFIVARYGEFVLLDPPFGVRTVVLWLAPLVILFAIGLGFIRYFRRRQPGVEASTPVPLSAREKAELDAILGSADTEPPPENPVRSDS